MDIIDIILARALTPQGQIEQYAALAGNAVNKASEAVTNIESITEQTTANSEAASTALENAAAALEAATQTQSIVDGIVEDVSAALKGIDYEVTSTTTYSAVTNNLHLTYEDESEETVPGLVKMYRYGGPNEDGTMTQKAITDAIDEKVEQIITDIEEGDINVPGGSGEGGGGISNLGENAAGYLVTIDTNGDVAPSTISEEAIAALLIKEGLYRVKGTVGIIIDYENKTVERTQDAAEDDFEGFDNYIMYGGRGRCTVDDNGGIREFRDQTNIYSYAEDGSNGNVMVYQPKFYYRRDIIKSAVRNDNTVVLKESLILSPTPKSGFKVHPLFIDEDGEEVEYALFGAYESGIKASNGTTYQHDDVPFTYDTALCSQTGVKPISGVINEFDLDNANRMAQLISPDWGISDMRLESANQMLMMVEYATLDMQDALEKGLSDIPNDTTKNCASLTGSTEDIGSGTGAAEETINENNGNTTTYSVAGRRAICYRGMENPWGNMWRMVNNIKIVGDGTLKGGQLYIYDNNSWVATGYILPNNNGWVSAFGYDKNYDWIYLPAECNNSTANSALPVGDNIWVVSNLNNTMMLLVGGTWAFGLSDGPFYYAADREIDAYGRNINARLVFKVNKSELHYQGSYESWYGVYCEDYGPME